MSHKRTAMAGKLQIRSDTRDASSEDIMYAFAANMIGWWKTVQEPDLRPIGLVCHQSCVCSVWSSMKTSLERHWRTRRRKRRMVTQKRWSQSRLRMHFREHLPPVLWYETGPVFVHGWACSHMIAIFYCFLPLLNVILISFSILKPSTMIGTYPNSNYSSARIQRRKSPAIEEEDYKPGEEWDEYEDVSFPLPLSLETTFSPSIASRFHWVFRCLLLFPTDGAVGRSLFLGSLIASSFSSPTRVHAT